MFAIWQLVLPPHPFTWSYRSRRRLRSRIRNRSCPSASTINASRSWCSSAWIWCKASAEHSAIFAGLVINFVSSAGRYNKPEPNDTQTQSDVSPSDEGCADMTVSCISSNSMEYVLRIYLQAHAFHSPFRIYAFLFYLKPTTNWHNTHTHRSSAIIRFTYWH